MAKKKPVTYLEYIAGMCNLPPLKVGTPCVITRPHLWSSCAGTVESYNPDTKMHYVAVVGKNGCVFHTECHADVLKVDYERMLGL